MVGVVVDDDVVFDVVIIIVVVARNRLELTEPFTGLAAAAGCQLVAACDIALCTEASRFSTPGANVGLFCSTPGVAVSRSANLKAAAFMLLTGTAIDAQHAYSAGLVTKVAPDVTGLEHEVRMQICAVKL